jgi:hypothetical protein
MAAGRGLADDLPHGRLARLGQPLGIVGRRRGVPLERLTLNRAPQFGGHLQDGGEQFPRRLPLLHGLVPPRLIPLVPGGGGQLVEHLG